MLITGNRASGTESLEQTIQDQAKADSLSVVTIGDLQHVACNQTYARETAITAGR